MNIAVIVICSVLSIFWIAVLFFFGERIWSIINSVCRKMKDRNIVDLIYILLFEIIEIVLQILIIINIKSAEAIITSGQYMILFLGLSIFCAIEDFIIFCLCTDKI